MNITVLADLHISHDYFVSSYKLEKFKRILHSNIPNNYDIILIAGDVFEHFAPNYINVFSTLDFLFNGKPVVFCLGNHEFAYENYNNVLSTYKKMNDEYIKTTNKHNICCLDISNFYDITNTNYRIVGNVFWYDFSLNKNMLLMKGDILDNWLDSTIINFDPIKEHEICKQNILNSINSNKNHILLTHTVPHIDLNAFSINEPYSAYNAYSGVNDFLNTIKNNNFKWAFCGHTHIKESKVIHNINCVNIGNDYYFKTNKITSFSFDI